MIVSDNGVLRSAILVPAELLAKPELAPPGLYDTIRVDSGRVIAPERHFARLETGARYFDFRFPLTYSDWTERVAGVARANRKEAETRVPSGASPRNSSFRVRTTLTLHPDRPGATNIIMAAWPVDREINAFPSVQLRFEFDPDRAPGDTRYCHKRLGLTRRPPDDDPTTENIMLNSAGDVCEARYANIFLIHGNRLLTPHLHSPCLDGITRALVIENARSAAWEVLERPVTVDEVLDADALFLATSVRGIVRVHAVEDRSFPVRSSLVDRLAADYAALEKVSLAGKF